MKKKNPHAVALGRKGGKARLETMTAEQRREAASEAGKASGKARKAAAERKRRAARALAMTAQRVAKPKGQTK